MPRVVVAVVVPLLALAPACDGGGGDPAGSGAPLCVEAERFIAALRDLDERDAPTAERVAAAKDAFDGADVPRDVARDLEDYLEGLDRFAAFARAYEADPSTATSFDAADKRRYEEAAASVMQHLGEECGIEWSGTPEDYSK